MYKAALADSLEAQDLEKKISVKNSKPSHFIFD